MPEKIRTGHYKIGTKESTRQRDPDKEVGVIKGQVANEHNYGGFGRVIGLSKSKWYVYERAEHLRQYADRSGTGVMDVVSLEEECNSKSDAVSVAENKYRL